MYAQYVADHRLYSLVILFDGGRMGGGSKINKSNIPTWERARATRSKQHLCYTADGDFDVFVSTAIMERCIRQEGVVFIRTERDTTLTPPCLYPVLSLNVIYRLLTLIILYSDTVLNGMNHPTFNARHEVAYDTRKQWYSFIWVC